MGFRDTDACLAKVAPDEPIFVLRSQDKFAPDLVRAWAQKLENYVSAQGSTIAPERRTRMLQKIAEARTLVDSMTAWPTRKIPD